MYYVLCIMIMQHDYNHIGIDSDYACIISLYYANDIDGHLHLHLHIYIYVHIYVHILYVHIYDNNPPHLQALVVQRGGAGEFVDGPPLVRVAQHLTIRQSDRYSKMLSIKNRYSKMLRIDNKNRQ
jgi:hypothetical protein